MSFTVSPEKQIVFWSIQTLSPHVGFCRGGSYTSLADRGNNMERNYFNKRTCRELFGGKLELAAEPDYSERCDARRQKDCLHGMLQIVIKRISAIEEIVQKMDEFCRIKRTCS